MTTDEIKNALVGFLSEEIDIDEITDIEYQCGGCWIDLSNGKTFSLVITETESE